MQRKDDPRGDAGVHLLWCSPKYWATADDHRAGRPARGERADGAPLSAPPRIDCPGEETARDDSPILGDSLDSISTVNAWAIDLHHEHIAPSSGSDRAASEDERCRPR